MDNNLTKRSAQRERGDRVNGHQNKLTGTKLTRRRIPLSCQASRGDVAITTCSYADKNDSRVSSSSTLKPEHEDMRARIYRLENSILSMISKEEINKNPPISPSLEEDNDDHVGQAGGQKPSVDTRSTHWDSILNDLGAMKDAWVDDHDQIDTTLPPATISHRPSLLGGLTEPPDRSTILSSLPTRLEADKLIDRFFASYNPSIPACYLFHRRTYLKQIEQFWAKPYNARIIWIGLYFSTMCMALQSYARNKDTPPEYRDTLAKITDLYRIRTAQCLIIADITRPVYLMIEIMLCYAFIEYSYERDGDMGTWLLSGTIMRLALQQGYHRDPEQHAGLSVFESEMRRRVWIIVTQHELLFSVQIGLPKSIKFAECDTKEPSNLLEEELSEYMTVLPPSRPDTENTYNCYQRVKFCIMRAYGYIIEFLHIVEPQPYIEVIKLDEMLKKYHDRIPLHLQLSTLSQMASETPAFITEKFFLQKFYYKSTLLLHRKYWYATLPENPDEFRWFSRRMCVSSSMALLNIQVSMHEASQPGGILQHMKWWQFSITNHDFLLAAMIMCLDLNTNQRTDPGSERMSYCPVAEKGKLDALVRARDIWGEISEECIDAERAVGLLTSLIRRLTVNVQNHVALNLNPDPIKQPPINTIDVFVEAVPNTSIPVCNNGLVPTTINYEMGDNLNTSMIPENMFDTGGIFGTFGGQADGPGDFDWDAWDQITIGPQALGQERDFEMQTQYF
ncbi:putative C6 transcription factor [Sclerotinia borealis F-4128]|uniref:Putative C6 transcription factor n=1 Tax=Sclerotinia borealis (strain F-4128) TaxID=1432307 RepID=W9C788_SCLBF|nr:putative C6 transcription factor [Sclerotinia borealis F-4128]